MGSISGSSYRPNPEQWHWELRAWFLYFVTDEQRYNDVVAALTPYWSQVLEAKPELSPETPYFALPVHEIDPSEIPPDPLATYILAVQLAVSGDLRCRTGGKPAVWVSHAVHAAVTGTSMDLGVAPQHWWWLGELQIPVLSSGSAFAVRKIGGRPFSDPAEVEERIIESPHAGTPFNQWKKLKKLAHEELDRLLDDLRAQVESKTGDWPNMYEKGRRTRTQDTMQKLVRWVVGREEQFDADRTRTNELLHELGLDPPARTKSLSKKLEKN